MFSGSFYDINGQFQGHFARKAKARFVALTNAKGVEIYKREGKWTKRKIVIPERFIGISTRHIEAAVVN